MKNLLTLSLLLLAVMSSCAQDVAQSLVPSVVVNSFQQKFPKASDIEWEKKGEIYEVEFELQSMDHKALIDQTGKIVKHKEEINLTDLPAPVSATIKKEFAQYKVDDAKRIETDALVIYKVEVEKGSEERKVYFDQEGKIVEPKVSYE